MTAPAIAAPTETRHVVVPATPGDLIAYRTNDEARGWQLGTVISTDAEGFARLIESAAGQFLDTSSFPHGPQYLAPIALFRVPAAHIVERCALDTFATEGELKDQLAYYLKGNSLT